MERMPAHVALEPRSAGILLDVYRCTLCGNVQLASSVEHDGTTKQVISTS
jgi:hypothetical protein